MITKKELRRFLGSLYVINKNRILKKTFVPHPRRRIFVEASSVCNLACRFCAYPKIGPGTHMTNELFSNVIEQVIDLKFNYIYMTPMLGDIFADPNIFQKFDILEKREEITGYSFFSNFVLPKPEQIQSLCNLTKLRSITVSVYGYDEKSFALTTQKPEKQFELLLRNLSVLRDFLNPENLDEGLHFHVRTVKDKTGIFHGEGKDARLINLLDEFKTKFSAVITIRDEFDSWGGEITNKDLSPLNFKIIDGKNIYMHGACAKLFGFVQIKADGLVHACACRDVDGSLIIGDISKSPLKDILSTKNKKYSELIETQEKGIFNKTCRSCSLYRSVYNHRGATSRNTETISLSQALEIITPKNNNEDTMR